MNTVTNLNAKLKPLSVIIQRAVHYLRVSFGLHEVSVAVYCFID